MITYNDLTFGVEIEGLFSQKLIDTLALFNHNLKYDGSVCFSGDDIQSLEDDYNIHIHRDYREVASSIIRKKDLLIAYLKQFDKKNYFFNDTTGLHLHIGLKKTDSRFLQAIACNYDFIKKLQYTALHSMCKCQSERLENKSFYCRIIKNKASLLQDYKYHEKYRFVRFHPCGTLEFRFLKPCQHKIKNVNILLDLLLEYLNTDLHFHKNSIQPLSDNIKLDNLFTLNKKIKLDDCFSFTNRINI